MADFIEESGELWDRHARRDPLWAILSDPARKGGRWDLGRFMQTGVGEVASLLYQLQTLGLDVGRGEVLDFGCGVGRLSQALAPHFQRVTGVDISAEMIEQAQSLNRFPALGLRHLARHGDHDVRWGDARLGHVFLDRRDHRHRLDDGDLRNVAPEQRSAPDAGHHG